MPSVHLHSESSKQFSASENSAIPVRFFLQFLKGYSLPHAKDLYYALAGSIVLAGISGLWPWVFKRATELLEEGRELPTVLLWLGLGLLAVLIRNLLEIITHYLLSILHLKIMNDMRVKLYDKIQSSSLELHLRTRTGEIASLVSNDVAAASAGVIQIFSTAWLNPILFCCYFGAMLYFNAMLSLFALAAIPVITLSVTYFSGKARKAERAFLNSQGQMLGTIIETLTNVRQIKSFSLEKLGVKKIIGFGDDLIKQRKKALLLQSATTPISELVTGLALTGMVILAYHQLIEGTTTKAAIVGCLAAAYGIKKPVKELARSVVELQRSMAAVQRITWFENQISDQPGTRLFDEPITSITVEDVDFSYDGRHPVLHGISLSMNKGERLAILGPSGVGKSTLVDLLIGFYPCQSGQICFNGQPVSELSMSSVRKKIGIVSQEPFLFEGTIEENIRHGDLSANDEQIQRAVEMAGCETILQRLPDGLQATVGERGERLSGGERKRVALARALVRPISVLILDEATSELDPENEAAILQSVNKLASELIIIHVSHRRSVINHSDRVVLLEGGRLRELPTEEALKSSVSMASRSISVCNRPDEHKQE